MFFSISEVIKDKTLIVIAHRLHTIANADKICVLDKGNLAAAGTHKELLVSCPQYQKLWKAAEGSMNWKVSIRGWQSLCSPTGSHFASQNKGGIA